MPRLPLKVVRNHFAFTVGTPQANSAPPVSPDRFFTDTSNVIYIYERADSGRIVLTDRSIRTRVGTESRTEKAAKGTSVETFSLPALGRRVGIKVKLQYRVRLNDQWSRWSDGVYLKAIPGTIPMRTSEASFCPLLSRPPTAASTTHRQPGRWPCLSDSQTRNSGTSCSTAWLPRMPPTTGMIESWWCSTRRRRTIRRIFTRSNLGLKTAFGRPGLQESIRTGVRDTRFTYLGIPHAPPQNSRGASSYTKSTYCQNPAASSSCFYSSKGYYETSDLQNLGGLTFTLHHNGRSPARVSAFAATPDGTTYAIDGFAGNGVKKDNHFMRSNSLLPFMA